MLYLPKQPVPCGEKLIWITKTPDTSSVAETLPVIVAGPAVVSTMLGEKLKSVNRGGVVSLLRGGLLLGIVLIIVGIVLGGLNVF